MNDTELKAAVDRIYEISLITSELKRERKAIEKAIGPHVGKKVRSGRRELSLVRSTRSRHLSEDRLVEKMRVEPWPGPGGDRECREIVTGAKVYSGRRGYFRIRNVSVRKNPFWEKDLTIFERG